MNEALEKIFDVSGRTVAVTGASGFFGRYMSRAFLEVGAKLVMFSRSDRLHEQVRHYQDEFGKDAASAYQVDFYDREELDATLRRAAAEHDVNVLINNAYDIGQRTGFNTDAGRLENSDYGQWLSAFESGIYWAVLATQVFGEGFRKKQSGSIINVSSMYGIVAPSPRLYEGTRFLNPATYSINKTGLIALTKYTASFWGQYGIRCNAIAPGPFSNVESETDNSVKPNDPFLEKLKRNTALGRLGHPNDLRGAMIFLASDSSSYITGQTIVIDGGWTIA